MATLLVVSYNVRELTLPGPKKHARNHKAVVLNKEKVQSLKE